MYALVHTLLRKKMLTLEVKQTTFQIQNDMDFLQTNIYFDVEI